eukprot:3928373-Rhodomonas_salina.1
MLLPGPPPAARRTLPYQPRARPRTGLPRGAKSIANKRCPRTDCTAEGLSLIHISEPTRPRLI